MKWVRGQVQIASKFGIHFEMNRSRVNHPLVPDSRPEVIRASVEGSLKRLQTDHIDLYFQHRIDPAVPPEEVAGVMLEMIQEGKILHWGISEANEEYLRRAHAVCPVTAVENRYSMMARQYEGLFPVLEEGATHEQYKHCLAQENQYLADVQVLLGLSAKLTTYVFRHSWASAAYHLGIPIAIISQALGHSSEKMTRIYLSAFDVGKVGEANKKVSEGIKELMAA